MAHLRDKHGRNPGSCFPGQNGGMWCKLLGSPSDHELTMKFFGSQIEMCLQERNGFTRARRGQAVTLVVGSPPEETVVVFTELLNFAKVPMSKLDSCFLSASL